MEERLGKEGYHGRKRGRGKKDSKIGGRERVCHEIGREEGEKRIA